jgi:hypothetical protein
MTHFGRRWGVRWCLVLGGLLAAGAGQRAAADETEVRQFAIQVDGKNAGQFLMTITKRDGGVESMSGQASVSVRVLFKTYTYSYDGTEHWKGGRLQQLDSSSNDDGKRYTVRAVAEGNGLSVTVNGQVRTAKPDVWPTTHWKLPPSEYHNKAVPLLDADTGKEMAGHLQYVGVQQLTVGGRAQNCYHFRVTGGPYPVDLWYDGAHRLVREEFTVEGHRTAFLLSGLRRP